MSAQIYENAAIRAITLEAHEAAFQRSQASGYEKVGEEMRAARKAAGLRIKELADRMGLKPGHLGDMELGRLRYSSKYIALAGNALAPLLK